MADLITTLGGDIGAYSSVSKILTLFQQESLIDHKTVERERRSLLECLAASDAGQLTPENREALDRWMETTEKDERLILLSLNEDDEVEPAGSYKDEIRARAKELENRLKTSPSDDRNAPMNFLSRLVTVSLAAKSHIITMDRYYASLVPQDGQAGDCLTEGEGEGTPGVKFPTGEPGIVQRILANPQNFYINIHNNEFPSGALRGQLGLADH